MTKKFKLNVPVFTDAYITVVFTDELARFIKRNIPEHSNKEEDNDYAGLYLCTEDQREFLLFDLTQFKEEDTIVHEAVHAAASTLMANDIWLTKENEETYAYTIEYIFSKINKYWKKVKDKMNKEDSKQVANGNTSKDKSGQILPAVPGTDEPVVKAK